MDLGHVILAKLSIGYNYSKPSVFRFEHFQGDPIKCLGDFGDMPVQLHFTNNANPEHAERVAFIKHEIPVFVHKDAKFNRLFIRGYIKGKYYQHCLDSIDTVQKVLILDDENDRVTNIEKYASTLIFFIL